MNAAIPEDQVSRSIAETELFDLAKYWEIVYAAKWPIAILTIIVVAIAAIVSLSMTPIYSATATLLIESEEANVVSIEEVYGIDSSQREYYQTQFEILNSRSLAEKVVRSAGLAEEEEYAHGPRGLIGQMKEIFLGPQPPPTEEQKFQGLVSQFKENLEIAPVVGTQLVRINFESEDPELAAEVANELGDAYIENHLEARLELTQKASSWLTGRLEGMRQALEESEEQLRDYQERENLVDVSGVRTLPAKELDELTKRLVDARKLTAAAKSQFDAAGSSAGSLDGDYQDRWEKLPGVLRDSLAQRLKQNEEAATGEFEQLQKRYGPKHPKYIAAKSSFDSARQAFRSRVRQIVSSFGEEYQQLLTDQKELEERVDAKKQEIQEINRKNYELSQLQREVQTNKQLYDMFFQRFKETNQTDFSAANARFVDKATRPFSPVKPRKKVIVALAAFLSVMLGAMIALLRAALDDSVHSGEEIEEKLMQSVLGVVPLQKLSKKALENDSPARFFTNAGSHNSFVEAIRSVRTSVLLSGLEKDHKLVVVTSTVPGEGKTTISSNLALALGQMEKVLLIDADMRRPSLAIEYGVDRKSPGLAEIIAGTASLKECIHTREEGIDLIIAGSVPPNPLELLSSRRFHELLEKLSEKYDRIIIDSAPTQAVSDSLVLSQHAHSVVFVTKADATSAKIVNNALDRLRKAKAPLIGVVLNQFDASNAGAGYKYGYYGYGYSSKHYS